MFSWLTISMPHWNWHAFQADFTMHVGIEQIVGWFGASLPMAAIVRRRAGERPA